MADRLTKEQRHKNMSAIRGKNTKPEIIVRKYLFSKGFRYRLNHARLPGHPDIVLRKYRTVIFVNGCFWHGHSGCKYFVLPKTNTEFWENKISPNLFHCVPQRSKAFQVVHHLADNNPRIFVVRYAKNGADCYSKNGDAVTVLTWQS